VNDNLPGDKTVKDATPLNKYEALAILFLQKQELDGCSPEEIVGRYIETQDRIIKEFSRQKEIRKRRLNPLPL
jgi:hypothetical protein